MNASSSGTWSAARLRRNRGWLAVGASPIALAGALLIAYLLGYGVMALVAAPFVGVIGGLLLAQMWTDDPSPRRTPGELAIEPEAVTWKGERLVARAAIEDASYFVKRGLGAIVRLHVARAPAVRLLFPDDRAARHFIRRLGFGPDKSTARFTAMSHIFQWHRFVRVAVVSALYALAFVVISRVDAVHEPWVLWAAPLVATLLAVVLRFSRTTIEVGADGLSLAWLGVKKVVTLDRIEWINATEQHEVTRHRWGSTVHRYAAVEIRVDGATRIVRFGATEYDFAQAAQLVERVEAAMALRARGSRAGDTTFVARGGRDAIAWVRALRAAATSEGDMRVAPVPVDRFWRVVEDGAASPVDRAAAAVAIGKHASSEDRERVRIAAHKTIDPTLRAALERSVDAEAEDEAVAEALAAVERRHLG